MTFLACRTFGALLLLTAPLLAAPPAGEMPAEKLRKALDQPVTLDIPDQPLAQALNVLREKTKINFVLDAQVQMLAQMDPNQTQPVSLHVRDTRLKTALRSLISRNNLTYAIVGDTIVITTEELAMYRQLRQRVSLDLDAVPLARAVRDLARETGANLVVDGKVEKEAGKKVSLQLDDVPLETAIRLLCENVGLKTVRMGNVLYVTSKANANELRSDPDLAPQTQPNGAQMQEIFMMRGGMAFPGGFMPGGAVPVLPPPPPPETSDPKPPTEAPPADKDKPAEKKP